MSEMKKSVKVDEKLWQKVKRLADRNKKRTPKEWPFTVSSFVELCIQHKLENIKNRGGKYE